MTTKKITLIRKMSDYGWFFSLGKSSDGFHVRFQIGDGGRGKHWEGDAPWSEPYPTKAIAENMIQTLVDHRIAALALEPLPRMHDECSGPAPIWRAWNATGPVPK